MVHAGPSIGHAEYRHLVAAFNGGFLLSAGAGGYEQEGHVISPLRPGLATLVIHRSGAARIWVWGAGLPQPHEAVYSIRQYLPPLVSQGQPARPPGTGASGALRWAVASTSRAAHWAKCGWRAHLRRSMSTAPAALAAALVHVGARTAMELDINPEWVQLDIAWPTAPAAASGHPGQAAPRTSSWPGGAATSSPCWPEDSPGHELATEARGLVAS